MKKKKEVLGSYELILIAGVLVFWGFLNITIPEILKSKNLRNISLNKLPKK